MDESGDTTVGAALLMGTLMTSVGSIVMVQCLGYVIVMPTMMTTHGA